MLRIRLEKMPSGSQFPYRENQISVTPALEFSEVLGVRYGDYATPALDTVVRVAPAWREYMRPERWLELRLERRIRQIESVLKTYARTRLHWFLDRDHCKSLRIQTSA
jgi:hypothetical protein